MRIEYSSNNSGGRWWLKDDDWRALEAAGWHVQWGGLYFCHSKYRSDRAPDGMPEPCESVETCRGHRRAGSSEEAEAKGLRWLGALAQYATVEAPSRSEAIAAFERITGQNASAEGCPCCGEPHYFTAD